MSYRFMRFPGGKSKAVTFSYDDGIKADLRLAEVCNRFGIKCTFNVCKVVDEPCESKLLTEEVKQQLLACGHEVAVHGFEHKAPSHCTDIEIVKDVLACREHLEKKFDTIIRGMAYPDCGITRVGAERYKEIRTILKNLGIAYARTLGGDNNSFALPSDWHAWMPTAHHDNPNVMSYAEEFVNFNAEEHYWADRQSRLFYLWGHSFEFDNKNNWNRLEEICSLLGNRDDIWYATNIEIHDYVEAYEALQFNSANTKVYNPTAYDVWFWYKEKDYCVKSGETIDYI